MLRHGRRRPRARTLQLVAAERRLASTWVAIRNASDPQISNPSGDMRTAQAEAEQIYNAYQEITTAGSVVATWATIVAQLGERP